MRSIDVFGAFLPPTFEPHLLTLFYRTECGGVAAQADRFSNAGKNTYKVADDALQCYIQSRIAIELIHYAQVSISGEMRPSRVNPQDKMLKGGSDKWTIV